MAGANITSTRPLGSGGLAQTAPARTHSKRIRPLKPILGGFVGTTVMTLMMYFVAPMMLGKPMDIAGMLGGVLGGSWAMGLLMHFISGTIIFPLMYALLLYRGPAGEPWLRGTIWG